MSILVGSHSFTNASLFSASSSSFPIVIDGLVAATPPTRPKKEGEMEETKEDEEEETVEEEVDDTVDDASFHFCKSVAN